ncbi:MAG: ABC transporter permease subunit [Bacteroidales bacterium]|nr:ABC transporter permease subunit [Bacteroidales bacterium]
MYLIGEKLRASIEANLLTEDRRQVLLDGLGVTVKVSLLAILFATLWGGAVLCAMRLSRKRILSRTAGTYIELMRSLPILILLLVSFYIIFATSPRVQGRDRLADQGHVHRGLRGRDRPHLRKQHGPRPHLRRVLPADPGFHHLYPPVPPFRPRPERHGAARQFEDVIRHDNRQTPQQSIQQRRQGAHRAVRREL